MNPEENPNTQADTPEVQSEGGVVTEAAGDDTAVDNRTQKQTQTNSYQRPTWARVLVAFSAVVVVVVPMMFGFFIGVAWNFCFKDCAPVSTFQGTSPLWMPLLTLVFTVPLARKITRSNRR